MSARIEPDVRSPIGLLAAVLQRHPELRDSTDVDALQRVALYEQQLVDHALRYTFNGQRIPAADDNPSTH